MTARPSRLLPTLPTAAALAMAAVAGLRAEPPRVENSGFEADAYTAPPGYAAGNGGTLSGWQVEGNAGINPIRAGAAKARSPFADNGIVPEGSQVAFMQNRAVLAQRVKGFRAGKAYRVVFRENGRAVNRGKEPARLTVLLGGRVIVSEHEVLAVDDPESRTLPYAKVESAPFVAAADGDLDLEFRTTVDGGVSLLLDDVRIVEIPVPDAE